MRISVNRDPTLSAVAGLAGAMLVSLTAGILQLIFIFIMNAVSIITRTVRFFYYEGIKNCGIKNCVHNRETS